jgi:hypothetical protein
MGTVDVLISGQIDAFNANSSQTTSGIITRKVETDGVVTLKVTARLISVERGAIVTAPSAATEQKAVLSRTDSIAPSVTKHIPLVGSSATDQQHNAGSSDEALRKLVDQAADQVAQQLSAQIAEAAPKLPSNPTPPPPDRPIPPKMEVGNKPSFVGISDGFAFIDKGSEAGIKSGDKFVVRRITNTGLKNAAGDPIVHHREVCTLLITSVEDSSASGKCVPAATAHGLEAIPKAGDELVPASK